MNQNDRIRNLKEQNYKTAPVKIPAWVNPFLRLSDNEVLNKLLNKPASATTAASAQFAPLSQTVATSARPPEEPTLARPGAGRPATGHPDVTTPHNGTPTVPPGEPPDDMQEDLDEDIEPPEDPGRRRRAPDATTAILPEYTNNSPNLQAQFVDWQNNNDPNVVPDVAQILNRIPRINVGDNDDISYMVGQPDTLVVHYENGEYQTFTFGTGRMVTMDDRSRTPPRSDGRRAPGSGPAFLTQSQTPNYPSRLPP